MCLSLIRLALHISGIMEIFYIKPRAYVKFSLYIKKAGVVSVSAVIFLISYVNPMRSLLIQRIPPGLSFRLFG